jgi:hypothetical protein
MNRTLLGIFLITAALFFSACDDDNPSDPGPGNGGGGGYFPNGDGTYYKYSMSTTDSTGSPENGTRTSRYSGTQSVQGINYQVQYDTIYLNQTTATVSNFRKTDTGVFYFMDTTGLSASIPDSIEQYLSTDDEVRALLFPLGEGSSWTVFKVQLSYGPIVFYPVDVSASYAGTENVVLNLTSGQQTKSAIKIKYVMKLTFDFGAPSRNYEAHAWAVDSIGIVKWEGNAALLNGISGGGIDFDDTTRVVTQNLIEYDTN